MFLSDVISIDSQIEGRGVFSQQFIAKGLPVWRLDTQERLLSEGEVKKLPEEKFKLAYKYKDKYVVVTDGSEHINHSCDPNLWWTNDETLVARRDILPGEELTYDYASTEINPETMPDMECSCGATNCRTTITYKDCLSPEWQKMYKGHIPSWTLEFIKKSN